MATLGFTLKLVMTSEKECQNTPFKSRHYLHSAGAIRAGNVPMAAPVKVPAVAPAAAHLQTIGLAGAVNAAMPEGNAVPAGA